MRHGKPDAGFHGPQRQPQLLGDAGMGLVVEEGQAQRLGLLGRQTLQRLAHPARLPGGVGVIRNIGLIGRQMVELEALVAGAVQPMPARRIHPQVAGDGEDPGRHRRLRRIEQCRLAPQRHQRFLRQLLGHRLVAAGANQITLHPRREMREQPSEGLAIALLCHAAHQPGHSWAGSGAAARSESDETSFKRRTF
ncbi:hypothetical protein Ddc_23786 [Ditylenchus destructor]|nr:hypothetical protein Ddc_23786 [Ditylenchus destructor]